MAGPLTASILIIGDEILAGHTQDTNSNWLAQRLHARGVELQRIETVPDAVGTIVEALGRHLGAAASFVFAVGGIGPTPDDRTYEAVAKTLHRPLEADPTHARALRERLADRPWAKAPWADPERSEGMNRMLRIPKETQALANPVGVALGCVAEVGPTRLVVLPGVPQELHAMFERAFEPHYLLHARPQTTTVELTTRGAEARLWDIMKEVERQWPVVKVGSYPQPDGRILLRLTGPAPEAEAAASHLRGFLARES